MDTKMASYIQKKKTNQLEIKGQPNLFVNEGKYLGLNLDAKLELKDHIRKKRSDVEKKEKIYHVI